MAASYPPACSSTGSWRRSSRSSSSTSSWAGAACSPSSAGNPPSRAITPHGSPWRCHSHRSPPSARPSSRMPTRNPRLTRRSAQGGAVARADEGDDADMSAYREFTGKTVEEALREARESFGAELNDLDFEILTPGSRGVLGMGAEPARIVAAPRQALGGAAPKREAAAAVPLPPAPPPPPPAGRPVGGRGPPPRGPPARGPRTAPRRPPAAP